ncbi:MAG: cob(I)yrinic acid a,c-diamide adenosyltransferase [Candidatus Andersenbacteria bacterium]|nr:cob(I)yrinic acid a,c-diamide adenosyltransferase [bacterium]MDZ4225720.1 cob(I)yrinic acid a,c-diamide adenosyltransferase [Candidatus Andersenbacteria bacterium]
MSSIYTKKGDTGETGLFTGKRVPKNHVRMEAVGTIDEANANIGLVAAQVTDLNLRAQLEKIQRMLFEIGAVLANPRGAQIRPDDGDVKELELAIDDMTAVLPELQNFIIPNGTPIAAAVHVARTVVRRAERRVVTVSQHEEVPAVLMRYLNRLSDYLFTLARALNNTAGVEEKPWHTEEG